MEMISLKTYDENHYQKTIEWLNQEEIKTNFGIVEEITLENHIHWLKSNKNISIKAIYIDNLYVGNIILHINRKHNSGFFQIYLGESVQRGKGFAKLAMKISLDYYFLQLNINRIWLKVFENNQKAINLYESLGFKKEGIERQSFYNGEEYKNQIVFSLLKEEWIS